jgi:hypothetical protein
VTTTLFFSDAFSGVVTIEKLKKEYKKMNSGGSVLVAELWDALVAHIQAIVSTNSALIGFVST